MNIHKVPFEILSKILGDVAAANAEDGPTFTFGLSRSSLPLQRTALHRYVRGPLSPDLLKWDATSALRSVCWKWHEWALGYSLKSLYIRRWKGGERWAELSNRREQYLLYELIDRPTGTAVYRDPFASLKRTVNLCNDFPGLASKITHIWVHGYDTAEAIATVFASLKPCANLTALALPWTAIRYTDAESWQQLLTGRPQVLKSLELQCITPTSQQAAHHAHQIDREPLHSVHFGQLRRLKIFGDTTFMPLRDGDLRAIARTATQLEEFHLTCNSSITIAGVMMVAEASRETLRVLEHSPRSRSGFRHPHPGQPSGDQHICETLRNCPKLATLSISLPAMCAGLFSDHAARFAGTLQVRAQRLCGEGDCSALEFTDALQALLNEARDLIKRRANGTVPYKLHIELFLAACVFEPGLRSVHGDFSLACMASEGRWPQGAVLSGQGPYGQSGWYSHEEGGPFQRIEEAEYLHGVRRRLLPFSCQSMRSPGQASLASVSSQPQLRV
ncbi:hypothetical protein T440DRAFT_473520 [Plenodomus tracheiphilus IPT5]|uniref:F-box domain-containing protein n=1 Tax=Plenodomus tracheiphilus IPT5 TaxID=1408161 RepID=A0A6A7AMA8_9PLEO|nr:hypothetical protein T440DRAFT_473520 [Plenodomus tracheiphilus IPT5]